MKKGSEMNDNNEEKSDYERNMMILKEGAYEVARQALREIEDDCLEFSDSLFGPIETLKFCLRTLRIP